MWKALYDEALQSFTMRHAQLIQKYGTPGIKVKDTLTTSTYQDVGTLLIIITLIACITYYYYFNSRFGRYYSTGSWFKFMAIAAVFVAIGTLAVVVGDLSKSTVPVKNYYFWLTFINIIYTAFLFFIISLLIKWGSPMGKRTPF